MRKITLALACVCLAVASCSEIVEDLASMHYEIVGLKQQVETLNSDIETLRGLIASMQTNFITDVVEIYDDSSAVAGYRLFYDDGSFLDLPYGRKGEDGEDGEDGADGHSPELGVRQNADGKWYWTIDGDWLLDSSGRKIVASDDTVSPKMKIENGYWWVSTDDGKSWTQLYRATGSTITSIFSSIDVESDKYNVLLKLKNGEVLKLPKYFDLDISLPSEKRLFVECGGTLVIDYSVGGGTGGTEVDIYCSGGVSGKVDPKGDGRGSIVLNAAPDFVAGELLVFIRNSSRTFMRSYAVLCRREGLSSRGTSNCYMISRAGSYKFYAGTKGCGTEALDSVPVEAKILWESFGNSTKPSKGDVVASATLKDGYVEFSTPASFREGNAVIAVLDASGNILWSWHIWAVKYDPDSSYSVFISHPELKVMQLNLGAVSFTHGDIKGGGLMYQWGRKDPFPGPSSFSGSFSLAATSVAWPSSVASGVETGTFDYSVSHPMTFISGTDNYSGWNVGFDSWWLSSKSDSDPCPPGWMVPYNDHKWYELNRFVKTDYNYYGNLLSPPFSEPESWYPMVGGVNWLDGAPYGCSRGAAPARLWAAYSSKNGDTYAPLFNGLNMNSAWVTSKSEAYPVRCVTEQ